MSFTIESVTIGLLNGLIIGTFALGIVLFYRAARFVNFAFAELGLLGANLLAKLVLDFGFPFFVALLVVSAGIALLSAGIELAIIRRLFGQTRLVLTVATIAVSQILLFTSLQSFAKADPGKLTQGYPTPLDLSFRLGALRVTGPDVLIVLVAPTIALALAAFLRFTSYGQAIRASSENPDAARLAGISVRRMSTLVWAIGGVLAVVTSVLYAPRTSSLVASALGPSLLVRALAASLIGRLTNLPLAFGAAVVLGVVDNAVFAASGDGSRSDLVIFLIVLAALLFRARDLAKANRDSGTIAFGTEARALPRATAALAPVRAARIATLVACAAAALVLPLVVSQSKAFLLTNVCAFALVGLSLTLLTGWAGQVSLGQFAILGVGAFTTARIVGAFDPAGWYTLPLAFVASAVAGAVVAVAVGLPAVRIQGLFLAVATLSFGVVATGYAFQRQWIVGDVSSVGVERPPWLATGRAVYVLSLGVLVVVAVLVRNLRRSGPGRLLVAVRDNDKAARADGVSATGARLVAFAASGAIAAVAGCIYAYSTQRFTASSFPPTASYTMLSMVIIGGLGSIPGALLGAVFLFGMPALLGTSDEVRLAVSGFGLLVFLLFFPKGLIGIVDAGRDAFAGRARRRADGLPAPPRLIPPIGHLWAVARGLPVPGQGS